MKTLSLFLVFALGAVSAVSCSTAQQAKVQADLKKAAMIVAKVSADGKMVVIKGCVDAPAVEMAIGDVVQFFPSGSDLQAAELAILSGETVVNAICSRVKALHAATPKS